jgi:hypothetical protein
MACRGVHFALSPEDRDRVLACESDEDLVRLISEEIEEEYMASKEWCVETDKAWDAIHRCLAAGYLIPEDGPYPRSYCILGGRELHKGTNYIVSLVTADQAAELYPALESVTAEWMRNRYFALDDEDYAVPLTEEDFEYTWAYFEDLPAFFRKAALAGRSVIFTVDQ